MQSEKRSRFPGTNAKALVRQTLEKYEVSEISPQTIKALLLAEGYSVIRFDPWQTSEETARLFEVLGVTEHAERENSFTYTDSIRRLVFVRQNVSEEEYLYLLALELGRILTACRRDEAVLRLEPSEQALASDFALRIVRLSEHGLARNSFAYHPFRMTVTAVASVLALFIAVFVFVISPRMETETVLPADKQSEISNNAVATLPMPSDGSPTDKANGDPPKADTSSDIAEPPADTTTEAPPVTPEAPIVILPSVQPDNSQTAPPTDTESAGVSGGGSTDGYVIPSDERTYYATKSGTKYHLAGCSYLSGRETRALTSADIQSGNYTPCTRCFGK